MPILASGESDILAYRTVVKESSIQAGDAETFWRDRLKGYDGSHLVIEEPEEGQGWRRVERECGQEMKERLQRVASGNRVTLGVLVQGAWAVLLSKYCYKEDIVYGYTTSGRSSCEADAQWLIGCFMNTLPRRVQVRGDSRIVDLLRDIQEDQEETREYEGTSLSQIRNWADVERTSGLYDLYETVLVYEDYELSETGDLRFADLRVEFEDFQTRLEYPIVVYVFPHEQLRFVMQYEREMVNDQVAYGMIDHLFSILRQMADGTIDRVGDISLLASESGTSGPVHKECNSGSVLNDIYLSAREHPDRTALLVDNENITYAHLTQMIDQTATGLHCWSIGHGTIVALYFDHCVEMVVAMLAVLRAGATYVPIDTEQPVGRVRSIVEDCEADLIICGENELDTLESTSARSVSVAELRSHGQMGQHPMLNVSAETAAYVIYTSGTTGKPKGVMISHANLANSTRARCPALGESPRRYLLAAPYSFDGSVCGIYWTLASGGALCLLPEAKLRNVTSLIPGEIRRHLITHVSFTPSLYTSLLELVKSRDVKSLELLIVAGEEFPRRLLNEHFEATQGCRIYNEYGPTEGTVWSTVWPCQEDTRGRLPVGYPVSGVRAYVVDRCGKPLPAGIPGEIYVGGENIAHGYFGEPALTAAAFVPDCFSSSDGTRVYATGDLGRWDADGQLECLGRVDRQVKVAGRRVELEEVERHLMEVPTVGNAAVIARQQANGRLILDAAVVLSKEPGRDEERLVEADILTSLSNCLPRYMMPS